MCLAPCPDGLFIAASGLAQFPRPSPRLREKLATVLRLTFNHARTLGQFVAMYKMLLAALDTGVGSSKVNAFVSAAICGYHVWGAQTAVNTQVNMYLLGRVAWGLSRVGMKYQYLPTPKFGKRTVSHCHRDCVSRPRLSLSWPGPARPTAKSPANMVGLCWGDTFPLYAATLWGIVLYLFEHEPASLQGSLRSSMTYLYHDSNHWEDLRTFIWHNK